MDIYIKVDFETVGSFQLIYFCIVGFLPLYLHRSVLQFIHISVCVYVGICLHVCLYIYLINYLSKFSTHIFILILSHTFIEYMLLHTINEHLVSPAGYRRGEVTPACCFLSA